MTRLQEQITTPAGLAEAFTYTADFNNLADWDPGIADSAQQDNGDIAVGTRFEVTAVFGGRRVPMVYTITEFEPPHRVVLVGEGSTLTAVDEITFAEVPQGTAITYTADLSFKGLMRFAAPFLSGVLQGVGRKAVDGLAGALETRATHAP